MKQGVLLGTSHILTTVLLRSFNSHFRVDHFTSTTVKASTVVLEKHLVLTSGKPSNYTYFDDA